MKSDLNYDEYSLLTGMLEEINLALKGGCNDIDCDKYIYKNLLKKNYKPTLEHNFSCLKKLKIQKSAIMRLLSMSKFKKFRYENCVICKKQIDKLSDKSTIVSFTRPSLRNKKYFEWKGIWSHNNCEKKVKIPEGWKKGF